MTSFHLTIDSMALGCENPEDLRIYFKDKIPSHLTKVALKSVCLHHEKDIVEMFKNTSCEATPCLPFKTIFICSDILDSDKNLFNGEKSDVLASIYLTNTSIKRFYFNKWENNYKNLKASDILSIRMYLMDYKGIPLGHPLKIAVTYELEFR